MAPSNDFLPVKAGDMRRVVFSNYFG